MTAPNLIDPNDPAVTPPADPNQTLNTGNGGSNDRSVNTADPGRELFLMALREKEQENARLRRELETRQNPPPPRVTGDTAWRELTEDPRRVIQEEVANAVKPLNDFVNVMQRREALGGIKQQIANSDPVYAHILNKFGYLVDQALANPNIVPNLDNVMGAINLVSGAIATGKVPGLSAADLQVTPPNRAPVNNNPAPRIVPPSVAPSAHPVNTPPSQNNGGDKPWESLTETQLAMARHFKMSPQEYWESLNGEVVSVDTTKGKKK